MLEHVFDRHQLSRGLGQMGRADIEKIAFKPRSESLHELIVRQNFDLESRLAETEACLPAVIENDPDFFFGDHTLLEEKVPDSFLLHTHILSERPREI
jgi:hypothetical protein